MPNETLLFDEPVSADVEVFCAQQAEAIRLLGKRLIRDIIEIGERLLEVRKIKSDGTWLAWLRTEFNWSQPTAFNFMRVAEQFASKLSRVDNLQIDATALYVLADPLVPEPIRDDAISRAQTGEHITKAKADQMVATAVADAKRTTAEEKERHFREIFETVKTDAAQRAHMIIEEATSRLSFNNQQLTEEISRLKQQTPDLNSLIQDICKKLNRQKLNADQYRWLAQILNITISDGSRSYQPISKTEIAATEENLRIASAVTMAFETLAGAPPPATLKAATWPVQRDQHRRTGAQIITWLTEYMTILGEDQ